MYFKGVANSSFSNMSFRETFQKLSTLICIVGYCPDSSVNRHVMVFKKKFHIASGNYILVIPDIVYYLLTYLLTYLLHGAESFLRS